MQQKFYVWNIENLKPFWTIVFSLTIGWNLVDLKQNIITYFWQEHVV